LQKNQRHPSIGKADAQIEVVLIEDFQCKNCRTFSQKVIPQIQSKYVKAGQVKFTLVPVSFLAGSQLIANAVLEVYRQAPREFYSYLKDILNHEGEIKASDLLRLAQRRGVDIDRLQACMAKGCHNQELEENLNWARNVMGERFRTPALYINGSPGSTYSFEAIQYQVEQILGQK
jgi:protein-disulfide isomerase